MRNQLLKLQKHNSTKSERRIAEIFKRNHIPFRVKHRIGRFEIDFLIKGVALEIDGEIHRNTNREKDIFLSSKGYVPLHISSSLVVDGEMRELEKELLYLLKANNYNE